MSSRNKILRHVRKSKVYKAESNDQVINKIYKCAGQCDCKFCPPWKNDNKVDRKSKRGNKKPRYKNKRIQNERSHQETTRFNSLSVLRKE